MKKGTCKFFNGIYNDTCEAGVCYRAVIPQPDEAGSALRLPCMTKPFSDNPRHLEQFKRRGTCEKYAEPTAEEIAEHERKAQEFMERMLTANAALDPIRKAHKGENWSGIIECPVCKGRLHLSHAAYNGHMRVSCETKDCVHWVE